MDSGVVSIDGTRIAATPAGSATAGLSRSLWRSLRRSGRLTRRRMSSSAKRGGDELPEQLRSPEGRREFFRRAGRGRQPDERGWRASEPEPESAEVPLELHAEEIVAPPPRPAPAPTQTFRKQRILTCCCSVRTGWWSPPTGEPGRPSSATRCSGGSGSDRRRSRSRSNARTGRPCERPGVNAAGGRVTCHGCGHPAMLHVDLCVCLIGGCSCQRFQPF